MSILIQNHTQKMQIKIKLAMFLLLFFITTVLSVIHEHKHKTFFFSWLMSAKM